MIKKMELLAPAGDWDSFKAAVENGADAVYLGGRQFSARQFAGNFDSSMLKEALKYAHIRDVNIYLTINTLMLDSELKDALDLAEEAYGLGVDGFIVQDIGFAGMLRRAFPEAELHASTQMTVYNLDGVRSLERLGFKRVVLARELSAHEIEYISKNTPLETEIFIHGALCISYSGQCLMSSIIGGRSGNRGKCAQPCRLPYEIISAGQNKAEGKGYIMSPKDLCSISMLGDIANTGVKSLKIEGRMKNPEYVATVVRVYRKYLDMLSGEKDGFNKNPGVAAVDKSDLLQAFNRGGFSTGYLEGKRGRDMMCFEKPKNWGVYIGEVLSYDYAKKTVKVKLEGQVEIGDGIEVWTGENESPGTVVSWIGRDKNTSGPTKKSEVVSLGNINGEIKKGDRVFKTSSKTLNISARESFTGKCKRKVPLECKITIKHNTPVTMTIKDQAGNEINVSGGITPEKAINRALTKERVIEQAAKTGDTPFEFSSIEALVEDGLSVPVSEINNIRRRALEELEAVRASKKAVRIPGNIGEIKKNLLHFPGNSRNMKKPARISVFFYNWDERYRPGFFKGADRLYFPFNHFINGNNLNLIEEYKKSGFEVFISLPSVTRGNYDSLIEKSMSALQESGIDGVLLGNQGSLQKFAGSLPGLGITGDYSFNIFNSYSLEEVRKLGLEGITVSAELNMGQLNLLADIEGLEKESVVYGRITLMTSEYCPVGSVIGGAGANKRCSGSCSSSGYYLKDRKDIRFPVICDKIDCRSIVLNSNVLFVPESLNKISAAGIDIVRLNITDESSDRIAALIMMHRDILDNGQQRVKAYKALIEQVEAQGFTRGHYFRGV